MLNGSTPVEFWFDLSSPYSYFAALDIDDLAGRHGREVAWRPFLLGVPYRMTGMSPLTEQPMRGEYARRDWSRLARLRGVPFVLPQNFPLRTQAPARMVYAVEAEDPARSRIFAKHLFQATFGSGVDISQPEAAASIGAMLGLDRTVLRDAATDERWKGVLRSRTDEAVAKGVFGSPFIIVDGEGFWGSDRLQMVDLWLERGGW